MVYERIKIFLNISDDDDRILNEPSLDPDFSHYWEAPKQELIPPVEKKSITKGRIICCSFYVFKEF